MKLVPNAGRIAKRSFSMWSQYLGLFCLIAPEAIFLFSGVDTNPRIWWSLGLILIVFGAMGRLLTQGIDHD